MVEQRKHPDGGVIEIYLNRSRGYAALYRPRLGALGRYYQQDGQARATYSTIAYFKTAEEAKAFVDRIITPETPEQRAARLAERQAKLEAAGW
jgi:hypothetical protein